MDKLTKDIDFLFEASWEVCNKVGGIYTVVKSKAALMNENYSNYFLIGPYFPDKAKIETQQIVPPEGFKQVFDDLEKQGIVCYYGKWLIEGQPKVILIDFKQFIKNKNDIKKWLWEAYRIDSLFSHWDFEEPMVWAIAVAKLLEKLSAFYNGKKIVGHFHEWLAGFALLYLKSNNIPIKTVFTTHATMLGRAIAGSGINLYDILDTMNPDEMARQTGVMDKYSTEKACSLNADIFTTVSETTAYEAEKILGRKAEVILANGLDLSKFMTFEELSIKHREYRERIRELISYFFFPYYGFDIEQTLNFFIVGRYEFKNKGIDVFIKALGKLNQRLIAENSKKTIIAFFWVPSGTNGIKTELLENEENYSKIVDFIDSNIDRIKRKLIYNVLSDQDKNKPNVFDSNYIFNIRKLMLRFKKNGNPLISTHHLFNEKDDIIIKSLIAEGLDNKSENKVKVIFYPVYLSDNDGLLNLGYYNSILGSHLGIFPSYYEPWGYTPLESAALGVPAITTDLSGFGKFLESKGLGNGGIFVLKRHKKPEQDIVSNLAEILYTYTKLRHDARVEQKLKAKEISKLADWKMLIKNYFKAHSMALHK